MDTSQPKRGRRLRTVKQVQKLAAAVLRKLEGRLNSISDGQNLDSASNRDLLEFSAKLFYGVQVLGSLMHGDEDRLRIQKLEEAVTQILLSKETKNPLTSVPGLYPATKVDGTTN